MISILKVSINWKLLLYCSFFTGLISSEIFCQVRNNAFRFFGETHDGTYQECIAIKVKNREGVIVPIPCIKGVERIILETFDDQRGKSVQSNPFYANYLFNFESGYVLLEPERELTGLFHLVHDLQKGYDLQVSNNPIDPSQALIFYRDFKPKKKEEDKDWLKSKGIQFFEGTLQDNCLNKNDTTTYIYYEKTGNKGDLGGPIINLDNSNTLMGIVIGSKNSSEDFGIQIQELQLIDNENLEEWHYSILNEILTISDEKCNQFYVKKVAKDNINAGKIKKKVILSVHKKAINNLMQVLRFNKKRDDKTPVYYDKFFADKSRYGETGQSVIDGYTFFFKDNHTRLHEMIHHFYRFKFATPTDLSLLNELINEIEILDQAIKDKRLTEFENEIFTKYEITNDYLFDLKFQLLRKPEYFDLLKDIEKLIAEEQYIQAEITRNKAINLHKDLESQLEYRKKILEAAQGFIFKKIDSAKIILNDSQFSMALDILKKPKVINEYFEIQNVKLDSLILSINNSILQNKEELLNYKEDELANISNEISTSLNVLYEKYKSNTGDIFNFIWNVKKEDNDLLLELEVGGTVKKNSFGITGNAESKNFIVGKYDSKALNNFFLRVIIPSLKEIDLDPRFVLNPDSTNVMIVGTADGLKFHGSLSYKDEYGPVELKTKDQNIKLAKVRGLLAKALLQKSNIDFLQKKQSYNVQPLIYSEVGPQYRKVILTIRLSGFTKQLTDDIEELKNEISE